MNTSHLPRHPFTGLTALGFTRRGPVWPVAGGAPDDGDGDGGTGDGDGTGGTPPGDGDKPGQQTFSQADVDRIVADRLKRVKPARPADYDDLKAKAAKFDELDDMAKTESQKLAEERDRLAAENAALKAAQVRVDAAVAAGLTAADAQFLTAADADGAKAQAEALAKRIKPPAPALDQGARDRDGKTGGGSVQAGYDLYQQQKKKKTSLA